MSPHQRQAFEDFAAKFCGVPYADLVRGETTGLAFGWACWQEAQNHVAEFDRSTLVDCLGLSGRARNGLENMGIKTIADLARTSKHQILKARNMGKKSLSEIESKLSAIGINLSQY